MLVLRPTAFAALTALAWLLAPAPPGHGEEPARRALEGVRASVADPAGWAASVEAPASGQWRVLYRPPATSRVAAQCEARVFPAQDDSAAPTVLMQAADRIAFQVGGEGFGLPGLTALRLLGRGAADAELVVHAGGVRLEGRVRLLKADAHLWALAWGLAPHDAAPEVRAVVRAFASTLEPDEPLFFDPLAGRPDPEEALVTLTGEEPLRRRHLTATLEALEAALDVRLPSATRRDLEAALRGEALRAAPAARAAYRDRARAQHEAQGRPAAEQRALRVEQGKALLATLDARNQAGDPEAARLVLVLTLGARPGAGEGPGALTRFEVEHLLDAAQLLAGLAADGPLGLEPAGRLPLREQVAARWATLEEPQRAAWKAVAAWAPDLPALWAGADASARLGLRDGAARLLRGLPLTPAAPDVAPPDAKALRGLLDASPLAPGAALQAALALLPRELARLRDLLPPAAAPK